MGKLMEYRGYHASIEYDAEDKILVGSVCGITDTLKFHGTTVDELESTFHQSIDHYLEMCEAFGRKPDKEFKGSLNIRIGPDLHRRIFLKSAEQGISLNQYIANALERSFDEPKGKETIIYMPYLVKDVCFPATDKQDFDRFRSRTAGVKKEVLNYAI